MIANIERVANLFVTKTVYAAILAVIVGISAIPFPLLPPASDHREHADDRGARVLPRPVAGRAARPPRIRPAASSPLPLPAGVVAAAVTLLTYVVARGPAQATTAQARTAATLALVAIGLAVLVLGGTAVERGAGGLSSACMAAEPY